VVGFLWLSLVFGILHNLAASLVAKVAVEMSEAQFVWKLARQSIVIVEELEPKTEKSVLVQIKGMLREQFMPRQVRLLKYNKILYPTVTVFATLSMVAFLIAFTFVPIFLFRLWYIR
jgi:hypothetical protein